MRRLQRYGLAPTSTALLGLAVLSGTAWGQTPDQAVREVSQGLLNNQPQVVWRALPASYQRDLNQIFSDLATQVDPEIWQQAFATLHKAVRVLDEKREYLLQNPMIQQQFANEPEIENNWDQVVGLLKTIASSELADLTRVGGLDVDRFLAETGSRLMLQMEDLAARSSRVPFPTDLKSKMRSVQASVLQSGEDWAQLRLTVEGEEPKDVAFVRVEGKWIPKDMAVNWDKEITEAQQEISQLSSDKMAVQREAILSSLQMAEASLDSLLEAQTFTEFSNGLQSIIGLIMMTAMSQQQGG